VVAVLLNATGAQARALRMPARTVSIVPHPGQDSTPEVVGQRTDDVNQAVVRKVVEGTPV